MCLPINPFWVSTTSSITICSGNSDLINTLQQGGRRRIDFWNYCIWRKLRTASGVGIRWFLSAYCLREPPLLTITEVAGIAFAIFFRFILCNKGNEDTCMRTCRQLTSNAIQDYASNRRDINNQPPSSLPRLQHAFLHAPASVAALGHVYPLQQHRQG
jgi:hypothetical protein